MSTVRPAPRCTARRLAAPAEDAPGGSGLPATPRARHTGLDER
jgi:hypothetical protein